MNKLFRAMSAGLLATACGGDGSSDSSPGSEATGAETMTSTTAGSSATSSSMTTSNSDDDGPIDSSGSVEESSDGSNDVSSEDGSSSDGGAQGCADYLFCEDFEMGNVGELPPGWTEHGGWDQGGSRAVLSTEQAHSGSQSLKGAVGTNGQFRIEHDLDVIGDAITSHWGRIYYYVKTPVALDGQYVHNTFVAFGHPDLGNGGESRLVDTVVDPQGAHQFLFNVPDDSCCVGSSYDYNYEGGWHCAEWYVDGATESFRFFYDGNEVQDIAFMGTEGAHIDSFESIIVGWINYQSPSTPNEGWFDDLAIDDEQIGCD
ncbi:MAG TPA: hypothetical protein VG755_06545 [Nannocystaceae bacterium]|nr:hypothetical protein [Nannocystaceae bacterium]